MALLASPPVMLARVAESAGRCKVKLKIGGLSPDHNPIEVALSKLKAHLRKVTESRWRRLSRRRNAETSAMPDVFEHDRNPP
jgi:hypothetical protein